MEDNRSQEELNEEKDIMKNELLIRYNFIKSNTFEIRETPRKFRINKANLLKLDLMNEIITEHNFQIDNLTDLNSLHYAAALTLTGDREPKPPHSIHEPDQNLNNQIENIRKWIGRITASINDDKLTPKTKKYLDGANIPKKNY